MAPETATVEPQLFLEKLELGVTGTIILMFCRMWDVYAATGRYLSTDFVVCDSKGSTMHATARGTVAHNFLKLKEGGIYSVKNFSVQPNKDEFRVIKNATFMLELDGATSIQKNFVKPDGFIRFLFQFVDFDHLEATINKYLIDAAGGQSVRVTLWGSLGELLIEKRTSHVGVYPIVLTCLTVKEYNSRLYLSSTSSTLILDDEEIPEVKQLKADSSKEILPVGYSEAKAGTLENLLMWSRNRRHDTATFHCTVTIDNVRTKNGWNFPSCGGGKCKKSITRSNGRFVCESCNKTMDYPVLRYRLELEVSNDTAQVVVVMFNETATSLVKCTADSIAEYEDHQVDLHSPLPQALANIVGTSHTLEFKSHTYYEHNTYESFTCWRNVTAEEMGESEGSSMAAGSHAYESPKLKHLLRRPSVTTPSKVNEGKKHKRGEDEDSDDEASFVADTQASSGVGGNHPGIIKNKRRVVDDNATSTSTIPDQGRTNLYQQAIASTSNYPFSNTHRRKTGATIKCKSRNATKGVTLTSRGAKVSYHNIGEPSYQCVHCNANIWYEGRINKGNQAVNPSFALCSQEGAFIDKDNSYAVDATTVQSLIQMLDQYSSVAKAFWMARDWFHSHAFVYVELHLLSKRTNARQYNKTTVAEVEALITNDFGDGIPSRDIIFQKWGLPHAHILLWLEDNSKCKTAAQIDDIILAELPSPMDDPDGYKAVIDYMLHGPCGKDGRYAPCTTEGKCSKHCSKQFYAETALDEDRYPIYHRWDNKATFKKGKFTFYNRYLVPCEAMWRLFSFDIHYSYPSVMKLYFHLPNQNPVTLWDSEFLPALFKREGITEQEWKIFNRLPRSATPQPTIANKYGQPPGGTWKSFLYNTIIARLRIERKIVLAVASSGIAALLLPGGRTAHRRFIIPLEFNQWVLSVGNGNVPAKAKDREDEPTWIQIPEQFLIKSLDSPIEKIVAETYPNFIER
ncbi:replication protein A 70 kDa DNA-binding subunit C-like protein [Tanacetum coccineum]